MTSLDFDDVTIKNTQDYESSDLAGATLPSIDNKPIGVLPAYNQLLSHELIDARKVGLFQDPDNNISTQATDIFNSDA